MGVNPGSEGLSEILFCTNCGDCIDACAVKAVGYTWDLKGGAKHNEYVETNNQK
jgi:ferredoxin-type protein NapH